MRLYKRNGIYQVTYQSTCGKQVRYSLKTRNKRIAQQKCAKLELEIHEVKIFGKEPARSFNEMMTNYLEAKRQRRGFSRIQHACRPLLSYFGNCDVTQLNESHVERYIAHRLETLSSGTVCREVGVLSAAFNHAIKKHQWRIANPCIKAAKPKEPKGRVRYLTRLEAERLLQAATDPVDSSGRPFTGQYKSPVLRDFLELALHTGCRKGELLSLRWENVDFSNRLIYLDKTKSGEWQTVPINDVAREVLVRRVRLRNNVSPDTPWVFFHVRIGSRTKVGDRVVGIRQAFSTACRRAGIKDFRIHDLRHTFASWLVMEGVPLLQVSKLLRHASIQMTERYAHLAPGHLHDAVATIEFSAQFQHTEKSTQSRVCQNG